MVSTTHQWWCWRWFINVYNCLCYWLYSSWSKSFKDLAQHIPRQAASFSRGRPVSLLTCASEMTWNGGRPAQGTASCPESNFETVTSPTGFGFSISAWLANSAAKHKRLGQLAPLLALQYLKLRHTIWARGRWQPSRVPQDCMCCIWHGF